MYRSANETTHADMTNLKDQMDTINARVTSLSEAQQPSESLIQIKRIEDEIKTLISNMAVMNQKLELSGARIAETHRAPPPSPNTPPERRHLKPYEVPITQNNIKVLICMDSNGRRLDRRKFWTLNGSVWRTTYKVEHIKNVLSLCTHATIDTILISVGTNDVDFKSGLDVAEDIRSLVESIHKDRPNTKIVVSEATPRSLSRDAEIKSCNEKLHMLLRNVPYVFMATQGNLRDEEWSHFDDDKHVSKSNPRSIPIFARNLKAALRKATSTEPVGQSAQHTQRSVDYPPPPLLQHNNQNRPRSTHNSYSHHHQTFDPATQQAHNDHKMRIIHHHYYNLTTRPDNVIPKHFRLRIPVPNTNAPINQ